MTPELAKYLLNPDHKKQHIVLIEYFWLNKVSTAVTAQSMEQVALALSKQVNNIVSDLKSLVAMGILKRVKKALKWHYYLPASIIRIEASKELVTYAEKLQGVIRQKHLKKTKKVTSKVIEGDLSGIKPCKTIVIKGIAR